LSQICLGLLRAVQ